MILLLALVFPIAIFAGGVAAISGFGIGSLLTPLLALEFGTRTAVLLVAIPHVRRFVFVVVTAWECCSSSTRAADGAGARTGPVSQPFVVSR